jgi:hypothetical protein
MLCQASSRRVIGTAPTFLIANGADLGEFCESILVQRGLQSQRAQTKIFFEQTLGTSPIASRASVPKTKKPALQISSVPSGKTLA